MKKLKEKLSAKLSKNGGFTLVEMLIVVAIIAILVAVSMPLVGSALESAREATDAANERAFKGALVSSYLLTEAEMMEAGAVPVSADTVYAYDAVNGKISADKITNGYGQSESTGGSSTVDCKGKVLYGKVSTTGEVTMGWSAKDTVPTGVTPDGKLVSTDVTD